MKVFILFYLVTTYDGGVAVHREPDTFGAVEQCMLVGEQLVTMESRGIIGQTYKCVETYK